MTHEEQPDTNSEDTPASAEDAAPKSAPKSKSKSKKERVLHTRVPAVLEQELKRLAQSWRVPVSNVVRTILEDAVDTVDFVGRRAEGELRGAAERLALERQRLRGKATRVRGTERDTERETASASPAQPPSPDDPLEGALGFTPLVLASAATCAVTGRKLSAGENAYLVLFAEPGRQAFVASDALPKK